MKDRFTVGLGLEVVAVRVVDAGFTAGVALRLTAGRVVLLVVAVRVVDATCASTAGVALQNNNAQTTNTTATTITTLFSAYIFSTLERYACTRAPRLLRALR